MTKYASLELGLYGADDGNYTVELRFSQPDSEAQIAPVRGSAQFDLQSLGALASDFARYGQQLSASLFADPQVRETFDRVRVSAQSLDAPLRIQLFVGATAPELNDLHWETLADPQDSSALLATGENVLFSRYLSSTDWRPVHLRPKGDLKGLVVIASPAGLEAYQPGGRQLAPLDVQAELNRARSSFDKIPFTALASGDPDPALTPTLDHLFAHLLDGCDILYLVCHGALTGGRPQLWLEGVGGSVAVVAGRELAARLAELEEKPRLVVLASCQSGGVGNEPASSDDGALAALGPRLVEAGAPVVLAMQGNITMQTVAEFMPVFFRELQRDGQIDRAVSVARGTVRERFDAWVPVLFLRLGSGRIWYVPGFAGEQPDFDKWPALLGNIYRGRCTPILGSGLLDPLLGSSREIAQRWAETYHFPMSPHEREDLPQVAQYLAVNLEPAFPRDELLDYLRAELLRRYKSQLPEVSPDTTLPDLMSAVAAWRRSTNPSDPYKLLASLPLPIFITTSADSLLADALVAAGKHPEVEFCRWKDSLKSIPSVYERESTYQPDANRPLVFQFFGNITEPDSLVITEDDYFDYLVGVTKSTPGEIVPPKVGRNLTNTALLFLGFQLDDWDFRVFFRSIMSKEGKEALSPFAHVAVQIDPEGSQIIEPAGARRYLERYFQVSNINIYWGSIEDFINDLAVRWPAYLQSKQEV